jgi:hypothetical protein
MPAPVVESKSHMRSTAAVLALIIALAPAFNAAAGDVLHTACGSAPSAPSAPVTDPGADSHAAHAAHAGTHDSTASKRLPCECGCNCGPGHGCTATSVAAPALSGTILLVAGVLAPAASFDALSSRIDPPLYRPPITRPTF